MKYDDLSAAEQARVARAAGDFLRFGGHKNLAAACEDLGMEPVELWNQIMREAGIPEHEPPLMIQVAQAH